MRYERTDREWPIIKPFLPNRPRGAPPASDRRVLNGISWILRSGAPWRDLTEIFGPYTTCYNGFVRWRRAGVRDQIMNALTAEHDVIVQMIDTSIVRASQRHADGVRTRPPIRHGIDRAGSPAAQAALPASLHPAAIAFGVLNCLQRRRQPWNQPTF